MLLVLHNHVASRDERDGLTHETTSGPGSLQAAHDWQLRGSSEEVSQVYCAMYLPHYHCP